MATFDLYVRDSIWTFFIPFSVLAVLLIVYLTDTTKSFRKRILARTLRSFNDLYITRTAEVRKELFSDLEMIVSNVTELRNKGLVRILEIGVGSGTNLQYYPQQCRLVVVDPNTYFKQFFSENSNKFSDICLEKYIVSSAENIRAVKRNTVDIVVTTGVLCSVDDIPQVLSEIRRVLVPGGRYYFLEHVRESPHERKRYLLQKILGGIGIWSFLNDGCAFNDLDVQIAQAGFKDVDQRRFRVDSSGSHIMYLLEPHIVGVATK